jgi:ADA HAT complex component 1
MFRFSSWISESRGGDEAVNGASPGPTKSATILPPKSTSIETIETTKRKRDEVGDVKVLVQDKLPAAKRTKQDMMESTVSMDKKSRKRQTAGTNGIKMDNAAVSVDTLRDAIESQLSLEILLKHDELRLINQEMAKCQIALEQLRRCHLIPFPTSQNTQSVMQNISNGTGPALITPQKDVRPPWAAPYGVADGPYSRHYAKWLIPDPAFDGMQADWERGDRARAGNNLLEGGRTTRHSFAEGYTPASKMRTHRGSSGQKLQALPSGYTPSKENAGPSILKRADGQLVKLVCIDCRRENFGSTQGFINHCRIAHRREFKSHEEAAVQSGQPVELDEVGGIVGEDKGPSVATGLVHPLIRSAPTDAGAYSTLLSRIQDSLNLYHQGKLPGITSIPGTPVTTPYPERRNVTSSQTQTSKSFVASTDTPFLSNLMKSRGFDGNLEEIVGEAKKVVDPDDFSSQSEESDGEKSPSSAQRALNNLDGSSESPLPPMRMPARAAMSPAPLGRPGSSKGPEGRNGRKPGAQSGISPRLAYATPINTGAAVQHNRPTTRTLANPGDRTPDEEADNDNDVLMLDGPSIVDLSPNTVASNNAPSLVSDDGEYDEGDDDAESSIDDSEGDDEGSDVAEINFEDTDGLEKVVPRTALRHRAANGSLRKEDKHVTFVSPVRESAARQRRSKK